MAIGKTTWAIAEGYIPAAGEHEEDRALRSHETACILNTGDQTANLEIWIYFTDRDPVGPYRLSVAGRRTLHMRFDELSDPQSVPRETDFASVIESDLPVVVQHTRLDARMGSIALLTTMAYGD